MPWEEEQERLTQEARLSVASPEEVVLELKRIAQRPRLELMGRDEAIEALLVERSHPLINLGLACYGTSKEVFKALYKHGLEKPADAADVFAYPIVIPLCRPSRARLDSEHE